MVDEENVLLFANDEDGSLVTTLFDEVPFDSAARFTKLGSLPILLSRRGIGGSAAKLVVQIRLTLEVNFGSPLDQYVLVWQDVDICHALVVVVATLAAAALFLAQALIVMLEQRLVEYLVVSQGLADVFVKVT